MLNTRDILETIKMIREEHLDVRTVTMGISLFDCISDDEERLSKKIYDKICNSAKNLVSVEYTRSLIIGTISRPRSTSA